MPDTATKLLELIRIITRLRAPDGCPWDRKQSPQSFQRYLIEESHELVEAINEDDPEHIREELGDLLFQVIFLSNLYQEQGLFTLAEVIESISAKMIRRHPHVFGEKSAGSDQELRRQWEEIKRQESNEPERHPMDAVIKGLPALKRCRKVVDLAANKGFDWPDLKSAMDKVEEEYRELRQACGKGESEEISEELGDCLFTLVVAGRKAGLDSEDSLNAATRKFIRRFKALEALVAENGQEMDSLALDRLLSYWQEAKRRS